MSAQKSDCVSGACVRRPLNEMVVASLAALQQDGHPHGATARDITNQLHRSYGLVYPIQTILVVLNRLARKGDVSRLAHPNPNLRHRYSFHLNMTPDKLREERIMRQFRALSDEFFDGNLQQALFELQKLLVRRLPLENPASPHFL